MGSEPSGRKPGKDKAGFTLTEALISIGIFAVVLLGILQVYDSMEYTYVRSMASADVQQSVRAALNLLTRDLRSAGYDPSNAIAQQKTPALQHPLPPVAGSFLANPASALRLIGDLDGSGSTECVAYYVSNGQIRRWKATWTAGDCPWPVPPGNAGTVVGDHITALAVTYWPATGPEPTADPAQVKRVQLRITATDPVHQRSFTAETEVALRQ